MFIVTQKKRPFTWFVTDHPNVKGQTIRLELEYEVIDRLFLCSVFKRNTPRDRFGRGRAATAEELAMAKAAIGETELARCLAESINPSIWTRARWAAKARSMAEIHGVEFVRVGDPVIVRPVENVTLPRLS